MLVLNRHGPRTEQGVAVLVRPGLAPFCAGSIGIGWMSYPLALYEEGKDFPVRRREGVKRADEVRALKVLLDRA